MYRLPISKALLCASVSEFVRRLASMVSRGVRRILDFQDEGHFHFHHKQGSHLTMTSTALIEFLTALVSTA